MKDDSGLDKGNGVEIRNGYLKYLRGRNNRTWVQWEKRLQC